MQIKLRRAEMVILASAHDPSIISPQWLKEKHLITEEPKQFVHTPDFSVFNSETFFIIVDRERLQITAKKQDMDTLRSLAGIGSGYIKQLPHISYRALGINLIWFAEINEEETLPKIDISIGSVNDLSLILTDHELYYGGIIYAKKDPYLLKLMIEPQGKSILVFNFNYHHEVSGLDVDRIIGNIDNLSNLYENSREVVENICLAEGKREWLVHT